MGKHELPFIRRKWVAAALSVRNPARLLLRESGVRALKSEVATVVRRSMESMALAIMLLVAAVLTPSSASAFVAPMQSDGSVLQPGPGGFVPIAPSRVLDTRTAGGSLQPNETRVVTVSGGSVPAGAAAVSLNVTVVDPSAGYLAVWPADQSRPSTSVLNYDNQQTIANAVTVRVSGGGQISVASSSSAHLIIDVVGWYAAPATTTNAAGQTWAVPTPGGGFFGITPTRVLDSRAGRKLAAGEARVLPLDLGVDMAGSSAGAVVLNVTAVAPNGTGYVTVVGNGDSLADVSSLNFGRHAAVANQVTAHVGVGNAIVLYASAPVDVIVDVMGFYTTGSPVAGGFVSVAAQRVLDTRQSTILGNASFDQRTREWALGIAGTAGVPLSAAAVTLNLTAFDASSSGYFTVWPDGQGRPGSSSLNIGIGDVLANAVTVGLGGNNGVRIYTDTSALFLVDVSGWFRSPYVG